MADREGDDAGENLYKVLIIGDVNTGKTSLVKQYVHGLFPDNYKATIGVDFALKGVCAFLRRHWLGIPILLLARSFVSSDLLFSHFCIMYSSLYPPFPYMFALSLAITCQFDSLPLAPTHRQPTGAVVHLDDEAGNSHQVKLQLWDIAGKWLNFPVFSLRPFILSALCRTKCLVTYCRAVTLKH